MKKLDTTKEGATSWSPYKAETKEFVQDSYSEIINALVLSKIKNSYVANSVVCLYGCVNTGSGTTYIISAGAVYCNGEVFLFPGLSSTTLASGAVFNLSDVADGVADPTTFSDNAVWNIHRVRTAVIVNGTSGTGTLAGTSGSDFANLIYTDSVRKSDVVTSGSVDVSGEIVHSFVPSATTNYSKMIATYSGTWRNASDCQMQWSMYLGATVLSHTPGTVGGSMSGGTLIKNGSVHISAGIDTAFSFSKMFSYMAGQTITIVASASVGSGTIFTGFDSELFIDSGTL